MNENASLSSRRPRLSWALVPVALLLSSAVGVGSMAFIAARDPHFATEPDYYQKAIRWDRTQAQTATNQRLGYLVEAPARVALDPRGHAAIELTLRDRHGQRLTGARLTGQAFANAYSGRLVDLVFEERSPGVYRAALTVGHPGQWVFQLVGDAEGERFTADLRADMLAGGSA
jgi:hypothetical protein